jgi:hypothetical protein
MEAKELRLGNLVQNDEIKIPYRVNFMDILYFLNNPDNKTTGVPLTPEILVKAGFDRVKDKHQDNYVISYSNWDFYSVQEREGIFYFSNDKSDAGCYVITRVDFVHKLQNLLYELSGKELNIELSIKIPEFPKDRIGQWKGGA